MCSKPKPTNKFHGYTSIILFFAAIATGIYAIAFYSITMAILNAIFLILMILSVSFYFCSKCPVRERCGHWIFGKVSQLVSKFKNEKYNTFDMVFGTMLPIVIVILLPQYWLIKTPLLLVVYWGLMAIAGIQVSFFVCTRCDNHKCVMCKNKIHLTNQKS
jgi:hypothetical protein